MLDNKILSYKGMSSKLFADELQKIPIDKKCLINTVSPNSYGLAYKNSLMYEALLNSDILVLDGIYFGLLPLLMEGKKIKRITGWDCFVTFSNKINETKGKVFFLGSTESTLQKIKGRYCTDYPNVEADYYSPPFKSEFSDEDNQKIQERINTFCPDILFIGMTAPKQEIWSNKNKDHLNTKIICTIGNVFDWYAGNSKRPGKFWQKIGMEWLVRIFYRPEIFKRNIVNQILFFWHLFLVIIRIKKYD